MSTAVEFPTGIGGKGNEGVAGSTSRTKGAIGYVEHSYAIRNELAYVSLKNREGEFVSPSRQSFRSAVANADWTGAPTYALLTDQSGKQTSANHRRNLRAYLQTTAKASHGDADAEIL